MRLSLTILGIVLIFLWIKIEIIILLLWVKITRRTTGARGCYQVSSINDPVLISFKNQQVCIIKYQPLPSIKNQISSIKYHISTIKYQLSIIKYQCSSIIDQVKVS